MIRRRTVFFVSDSTAITAETLGQSLLTQFEHIPFDPVTLPFIDTLDKAAEAVLQIDTATKRKGIRPLVFSTLINPRIRDVMMESTGVFFDFIGTFLPLLEGELKTQSSHTVGRYHGMVNDTQYSIRIDAVNYALGHDDGISTKNFEEADVILVGVSRTGKTPTCIYLGLQFGIYAANYPVTEEDFTQQDKRIYSLLSPYKKKIFGLTINPERLHKIRSERRPGSRYASLGQCRLEVAMCESFFISEDIPFLNITSMSIEEIAATIMHAHKLPRRVV